MRIAASAQLLGHRSRQRLLVTDRDKPSELAAAQDFGRSIRTIRADDLQPVVQGFDDDDRKSLLVR